MPDSPKEITRRKYLESIREMSLAIPNLIFAGGFRFGLDAEVIGAEGRKALDDFVTIFYFETRPAFIARLVAGIGQRQSVIALPALRTITFQHLSNIIQSLH